MAWKSLRMFSPSLFVRLFVLSFPYRKSTSLKIFVHFWPDRSALCFNIFCSFTLYRLSVYDGFEWHVLSQHLTALCEHAFNENDWLFGPMAYPRGNGPFTLKEIAMAKMSDTGEVDYWPGYVDALTSMVKVLTFMMMLLSLTVFTITQQLSRNVVVKIAEAAGVQIEPGTPLNLVAERVMTKLNERNATGLASENSDVATPKSRQNLQDEASVAKANQDGTGGGLVGVRR
jgi:hypothetical protein